METTRLSLVLVLLLSGGCSLWHKIVRAGTIDCADRTTFFETRVQPLLQTKCMTCHNANGLAQNSQLILVDDQSPDQLQTNLAAFITVAQLQYNGTPLVMLKPTGEIAHTGGKIAPPGSDDYATLEEMVGIVSTCGVELANDGLVTDPTGSGGEGPFAPEYLPATVRRLSFVELDASVADLLGTTTKPSASLAVDVRQSNFTANLDQRLDGTTTEQWFTVAQALADETTSSRLAQVVPCDTAKAGCDRTFVSTFASRAFRRPATDDEVTKLLAVFHVAADGYAFADGANAVIAAVLQSASFLYVPQVGTPGEGGLNVLDGFEAASVLSYLATGHAPDAALLEAAKNGELASADGREKHFRRLLSSEQVVRFVREWLGIDALDNAQRSTTVDFPSLRASMKNETAAFIGRALEKDGLTLGTLLAADFTVVDAPLASFYGLPGAGEQSLASTPRRGILSQAAFLATKAHDTYSSPVKRGVATLSKLLCTELPLPQGEVGKKAMAPLPPDPSLTTRERFQQHSTDGACAACHTVIDPLGYAFESFDQAGAFRTSDNGKPVDSTGELTGTDVDGPFSNAADLMTRLAGSAKVARCVSNYVTRFASTKTQAGLERTFAAFVADLPAAQQTSVSELLVAFVRSDLFMKRSVPQ